MLEKKFFIQINLLIEEFEKKFTLSIKEEIQLTLVEDPFSVNRERLQICLQLEILEMQCLVVYQNKHKESSLQNRSGPRHGRVRPRPVALQNMGFNINL